jgi:3-methyladenine DNA glycosylase AlkC
MVRINKKKVQEILKNIKDKDSFTVELISAVNKSISRDDPKFVQKCINQWEASAELNQIPGLSKKVCQRFNCLVKAGLVK